MNIVTIFPGAAPEDVELNVTVKLEEALKEVAAEVGLSVSGVRKRLRTLRSHLKELEDMS